MARRKRWSYAVGERPHTVTVFERAEPVNTDETVGVR